MKPIPACLLIVFIALGLHAQSPQKLSYQSVVRNAAGKLVQGATVGMKLSILQGSAAVAAATAVGAAAVGALQMGAQMRQFDGSYARAGAVITLIYAVGLGLIWFAPETRGRPLPD